MDVFVSSIQRSASLPARCTGRESLAILPFSSSPCVTYIHVYVYARYVPRQAEMEECQ